MAVSVRHKGNQYRMHDQLQHKNSALYAPISLMIIHERVFRTEGIDLQFTNKKYAATSAYQNDIIWDKLIGIPGEHSLEHLA